MNIIKKIKDKITFFDIGIIVIAGGIILFLFFLLFRKTSEVELIIKVDDIENNYSSSLQIGQSEKDELGREQVTISNIQMYPKSSNSKIAFLTLKIQAVYSKSSGQYKYKGQPLIVGMPLRIELDNILVQGPIIDIPGKIDKNKKKKELIVDSKLNYEYKPFTEVQGVPDYIVNAFSIGDTMKDARGEIVATILEKEVSPAKRTTIDNTGRTYVVDDPQLKDVLLKLKLTVYETNGEDYYLDSIRALVGEVTPIVLESITLFPTITKIYP